MNEKTTIKNRIKHIGEIPTNWKIGKVKHYYKLQTGFTPDTKNDEFYDNELGETWVTIADMTSFEKYISDSSNKISRRYIDLAKPAITPKGSLLYSFKLSVGKRSFAGKELYTNEAIASFVYGSELSLDFLYYSSILIEYNAAINIYNAKLLNQELIKNAYIVFPPINEQILIAGYLDKKCSKIDSIINDLEKQIETLEKYKKSVITEAVTKGLNLDVEMKDSSISWIGLIPSHWKVKRLKHLFTIGIGLTHTPEYVDEGVPFISVKDISGSYLDFANVKYISKEEFKAFPNDARPKKGDIIFGRVATLGCPKILDVDMDVGMFVSLGKLTNIAEDKVFTKFASYWMQSIMFDYEVIDRVNGSAQKNLNSGWLKDFRLVLPNLKEQVEISLYLDQKCSEVDSILENKILQIETIKKYKNSLIYEYVTGKKRVGQGDANE